MTKYTQGILDIVNASRSHLTAEQIFWELKKTQPKVVLATVYNNLNALCAQKLIRRVHVEGSPERYDRIERHDHLICQKCGKLADVTLADLTGGLEEQLGENITSYDLKVFYVCPECRRKAEGTAQ